MPPPPYRKFSKKPLNPRRGRPVNEARREEIIDRATQLFGRLGLHATTMERIARELKISKLTLYSRFADKDELFYAVIQKKCQQYIPNQLFEGLEHLSAQESLYRFSHSLMRLLTSEDAMNMERMLMAVDGKERGKLTQLFYKAGPVRVKAMMASHLQKLHHQKQLYAPNPALSTDMLAAMIKGSDICFRAHMHIPPKPTAKEMAHYCRSAVKLFMLAHKPLS